MNEITNNRKGKQKPANELAGRSNYAMQGYCLLSPSIFFYLLLSPSQYHNVPFPILLLTVVNFF